MNMDLTMNLTGFTESISIQLIRRSESKPIVQDLHEFTKTA